VRDKWFGLALEMGGGAREPQGRPEFVVMGAGRVGIL
jgi:hypothetical protein